MFGALVEKNLQWRQYSSSSSMATARTQAQPSHPVEIFVAGSNCGKVRSMRFVFNEELTVREGVLVYVETEV
jgi:hypothetical protein